MPIGVPRIIYCWGEELPAQWTDIYNFIFRRRMVFLMQYLDDELCNQICGLLINIHMEDRSKELEKKEMERSGVFKSSTKSSTSRSSSAGKGGNKENPTTSQSGFSGNPSSKGRLGISENSNANLMQGDSNESFEKTKRSRSMEDLLGADEDLGINEIDTLEQYTLQRITTEWLNWNAQFFDYSDEPYLFYLAESLSKDFNKSQTNLNVNVGTKLNVNFYSELLNMLKSQDSLNKSIESRLPISVSFSNLESEEKAVSGKNSYSSFTSFTSKSNTQLGFEQMAKVYSPFRTNSNFSNNFLNTINSPLNLSDKNENFDLYRTPSKVGLEGVQESNGQNKQVDTVGSFSKKMEDKKTKKQKLLQMFQNYQKSLLKNKQNSTFEKHMDIQKISSLLATLANKDLYSVSGSLDQKNSKNVSLFSKGKEKEASEKILSQRNLRRDFSFEKNFSALSFDFNINEVETSSTSGSTNKGLYPQKGILKEDPSFKKISPLFGKNNATSLNYLNASNKTSEFRDYYRKQTERVLLEEESKKVFVIINSFGGSVGNGVTVHDALQFIKAGSLTLGLGVAASAASLALAGGTIGERYVTEGCHVMIHQPESGGLQGQASDIWIDSQEIMKIRLDVAEIYSLSTYRPRHKILRDLDRDFYLTATETIQYGLADEIASNDVMSNIVDMVNRAWDLDDSKQQRLLESRESASSGLDTQTQN